MSGSFLSFEARGAWRIEGVVAAARAFDRAPSRLNVGPAKEQDADFRRRGLSGNVLYATRREAAKSLAAREGHARQGAKCAARIANSKSSERRELAHDKRRAAFKRRTRHHAIGHHYLPQVARKLHRARDLGEPFDFIAVVEFSAQRASLTDALVSELRASHEWTFISREADLGLRASTGTPLAE